MQNGENVGNDKTNQAKSGFFSKLIDGLKQKDEREVRLRLRALVRFAFSVTVAYFLGGAELFFGILFGTLFVIYVYMIVYCGLKLKRIRKKYEQ